ncbi:MAG: IS110 family transposase [Acidimicrobiales bacterium]
MTIVESRAVTGGVDTHLDTHVAAALNEIGGLLGVKSFPATPPGYKELLDWLSAFGEVALVGVEGTGSYGAGLTRYLWRFNIPVVEVNAADRQSRRQKGKSDPLDAVSAAQAAQSGRASALPKGADGQVEAIRMLLVAKNLARHDRTAAINQMRCLATTAPDELRERFAGVKIAELVTSATALRHRGSDDVVTQAARMTMRELGGESWPSRARSPGSTRPWRHW